MIFQRVYSKMSFKLFDKHERSAFYYQAAFGDWFTASRWTWNLTGAQTLVRRAWVRSQIHPYIRTFPCISRRCFKAQMTSIHTDLWPHSHVPLGGTVLTLTRPRASWLPRGVASGIRCVSIPRRRESLACHSSGLDSTTASSRAGTPFCGLPPVFKKQLWKPEPFVNGLD